MDWGHIGHIWCEGHGIYHDVFRDEQGCEMYSCGNCGYDPSDSIEFVIYGPGKNSPIPNDPLLVELNNIESTHGW